MDGDLAAAVVGEPLAHWVYRAEGGANAAYAYSGPSTSPLAGLLLRLRKARGGGHEGAASGGGSGGDADGDEALLPHDPLTYADAVVRPLVGAHYIAGGVAVGVPVAYLESWACRFAGDAPRRPAARGGDRLDTGCGTVVVMRDLAVLPVHLRAVAGAPPATSFCVELKPKCGVVLPLHLASPAPLACRFCMHQVDKAPGGSGSSAYCPFDLFSGTPAGTSRALRALASTPQNNFRLFVNGVQVQHAGSAAAAACSVASATCPCPPLCRAVAAAAAEFQRPPLDAACAALTLLQWLTAILLRDGSLLHRLRGAQAADSLGAEGAWALYARAATALAGDGKVPPLPPVPAAPPLAGDGSLPPATVAAYAAVAPVVERALAAGPAADADAMRKFLVATTAKDCSILVTLEVARPDAGGCTADSPPTAPSPPPADLVAAFQRLVRGARDDRVEHLPAGGRLTVPPVLGPAAAVDVVYSIAVVDVDPKPVARIPHYYTQEHRIVRAFLDAGGARGLGASKECAALP